MRLNNANAIIRTHDAELDDIHSNIDLYYDDQLAEYEKFASLYNRTALVTRSTEPKHDYLAEKISYIVNQKLIDEATISASAKNRSLNQLTNLKSFLNSYNILRYYYPYSYPTGYSGIVIVGAGPSLDKNIAQLANLPWHVFILSTNTAMGALIRAGITINAVCCVEQMDRASSLHNIKDVVHILDITTNPNNLTKSSPDMQGFIVSSDPAYSQWASHSWLPPLVYGSTVTTASISWAIAAGFTQIVLIGCDMAYAQDNRMYAQGSDQESWRVGVNNTRDKQLIEVPGWYKGAWVNSTLCFKDEIKWISKVKSRTNNRVTIIDATEGGAEKPNTEILPFNQVKFDEYPQVQPAKFSTICEDCCIRSYFEFLLIHCDAISKAISDNDDDMVRRHMVELPILDAFMASTIFQLRRDGGGVLTRRDKLLSITKESIEQIKEIIE
jgi:hypothetical protein